MTVLNRASAISVKGKLLQVLWVQLKALYSTSSWCIVFIRLQLHGAIYRPDSFVLMLRHCVNLKAIGHESTSLNRIATDKSHCVIVA